MPVLVCMDCGEEQRLDELQFVACRHCASSNLRPFDETRSTPQPVDG